MSRVYNYALFLSTANDDVAFPYDQLPSGVIAVNDAIASSTSPQSFARVDRYAGGYKGFEARAFLLAGNFLPLQSVAAAIDSVDWQDRGGVMLVFKGQDDEGFSAFDLCKLHALATDPLRD